MMTPVDDAHSMLVQFCYRNDTEADAKTADIIAFDRQVTLEDKYILEATEADVRLANYASGEKSMATDRPGLLIRRMLHELLVRHGEGRRLSTRPKPSLSSKTRLRMVLDASWFETPRNAAPHHEPAFMKKGPHPEKASSGKPSRRMGFNSGLTSRRPRERVPAA
jgi:hypothetical protein